MTLLPVSHLDSVGNASGQTDFILFFRFVFYGREEEVGALLSLISHSDPEQGAHFVLLLGTFFFFFLSHRKQNDPHLCLYEQA